jgi:hypothetical protein
VFERWRQRHESRRVLDSLHLVEGHLLLGWHAHRWPHTELLRFDSAGISAIDHRGDVVLHPWDSYVDDAARPASWSLEPSMLLLRSGARVYRVLLWRQALDGSTRLERLPADVVADVRARGVDADDLAERIRRHVEVAPWPFRALRPVATP